MYVTLILAAFPSPLWFFTELSYWIIHLDKSCSLNLTFIMKYLNVGGIWIKKNGFIRIILLASGWLRYCLLRATRSVRGGKKNTLLLLVVTQFAIQTDLLFLSWKLVIILVALKPMFLVILREVLINSDFLLYCFIPVCWSVLLGLVKDQCTKTGFGFVIPLQTTSFEHSRTPCRHHRWQHFRPRTCLQKLLWYWELRMLLPRVLFLQTWIGREKDGKFTIFNNVFEHLNH